MSPPGNDGWAGARVAARRRSGAQHAGEGLSQLVAARSAALRSTQNSLPSGSCMTTKPVPSGSRWSLAMVAPMVRSHSTSASRGPSGSRQRWTRFLTTFSSSFWPKSSVIESVTTAAYGSSGASSSGRGALSTCSQKPANS
ncbi:hypothetical protein E0H73_38255 [Kribbella pittospori]|uniref:Uncharacterized protein n=1 Tax=Kribbella pittospori TaxID=722689 RepID=A0A4R0K9I0_9ACTN|nr:hypothetical protein E0H73_38255 [Kribbella pittospori]